MEIFSYFYNSGHKARTREDRNGDTSKDPEEQMNLIPRTGDIDKGT